MKKILFLLCSVAVFTSGMQAQQSSPTPPKDDEPVVKISTDLIQIDVTVTDKNGKIVTGLTAEDFELQENGEKQKISNFSFISKTAGQAVAADALRSSGANAGESITAAQVRRTVAIMVDDLNLSFTSVYYTRKALRKFVDEQMQPGDLVAIVRTRGGVGALQQFTSDKRILYAAIEKIRWNPSGNTDAIVAIGQDGEDITERTSLELNAAAAKTEGRRISILTRPNITDEKATDYKQLKNSRDFAEGVAAAGSLGVMRFVIDGMKVLPGRKMMMLFSDGLRISSGSAKSRSDHVLDYLRTIVDVAIRASVVVYTFDARGLNSLGLQASEVPTSYMKRSWRARLPSVPVITKPVKMALSILLNRPEVNRCSTVMI